ncbi:hypothetical protein BDW69DRAFT_190465 [Aspergillus filifer]
MASNTNISDVGAEYLAESKVVDLWVAYSVPIPLEILSTGLRLWAELYAHKHGLAFDDYLMITATIFSLALCASGLGIAVPSGMGRHIEVLSPDSVRMIGMGQYVMGHMYQVAIALTKLSVLALYYRASNSKLFHRVVFATAAVVVLWLINIEILLFWVCQPISIFWGNHDGFCYDMCAFALSNNIINLCMDLWILVLPLPIIFRMRVSTKHKILLSSLFSIGLATCGVSAARIPFNHIECRVDTTYTLSTLTIFSMWEPLGGILCANIPIIYKPLGMAIRRRFGWSTTIMENPAPDQESPSWAHFKQAVQRKKIPCWEISTGDNTQNSFATTQPLTGGGLMSVTRQENNASPLSTVPEMTYIA